MESGEVPRFYSGRSLLVTGASGFMGKVLVEKLLYSCPDLHKIYILIRPKHGKSIETRLDDMFKSPLFQRLRENHPDALQKVVPLAGDVLQVNLGLTDKSRSCLQADVSVIIHSAATLRLEAKLKDAIEMNVVGTYRVLELAKSIPNLKVFIHLSTAFCHVDVPVMEEIVYDTPISPTDIMRMCDWMDDEALEIITPSIIQPHPNSYTYSKRLAEALVDSYFPELPVCIVRPSIVTPAFADPMPGWVDNLNGPMGLLVGGGKGVIRSMLCHGEYKAEIIPVDFAINAIIIIASKVGSLTERPKTIDVYNLTQGKYKIISWQTVLDVGKIAIYENPFSMMLWYPEGNIRSNRFIHNLYVIFAHWLPAYLLDGLLFIFGQKTFMVHVQTKVATGLEVLQYFTTRQWIFRNDKFINLREQLKGSDVETFAFPFEKIDNLPYITDCVLGARQYVMKEDPATLPRARRTLKMLWLLDRAVTILFYLSMAWMIVSCSESTISLLESVFNSIKAAPVFSPSVDKASID